MRVGVVLFFPELVKLLKSSTFQRVVSLGHTLCFSCHGLFGFLLLSQFMLRGEFGRARLEIFQGGGTERVGSKCTKFRTKFLQRHRRKNAPPKAE
jgi:hypothetical protein